MAKLTVIDAGFSTSIQDLGRIEARNYGVPQSGAMDIASMRLANQLLSNPEETAVIEMTLRGATFLFSEPTNVAIIGADCKVLNQEKLFTSPCVISIKTGDVLKIGTAQTGNFIYMAIAGGFQVPTYLNSASYYPNILDSSRIVKGTHISYIATMKTLVSSIVENNKLDSSLKAFTGPEFHLLNRKEQEQLLSQSFTVSKTWNSMAFQLEEEILNELVPIKSSPVLPGTIQLTPQGKLVILMRDAQTTGGYPRVLQLTENSISALSQCRVGEKVDFIIN